MIPSTDDRRKIEFNWYLLAALIIAVVAAWPLISGGGLINTRGGGDSPFLIQRLHQLETAIRDGHFPVRWMPDSAYGYGYPFFNFYAPLAFYVGFLYRLLGVSTVQAIQLSQLTAFIAAAWGSFGLARRWYHRDWVALVVSAAYTTAPFHLVNVYVRGDSIAEFWAMAFYPLVILAADQLLTTDRTRGRTGINWLNGVAWLALAYGGLVLSHNISAMIFSPFVLLFAVCRLAPKLFKRNRKPAVPIFKLVPDMALFVLAILLGVAASAWFWLPALSEQNLTSIADMTQGYFNYGFNDGVHFRCFPDLVQRSLLFDPSLENLQAFRMGLVQAAVTLIALLTLLWRPVRKRLGWGIWLFMVLGLAISTFMLNPLSIILWDNLPLLPFTQFPWRFLSVQAFFTSMLAGVPVFGLVRTFGQSPQASQIIRRRPVWVAPLVSGAISVLLVIVALGKLNLNFLPVPQTDVTAEAIAQYEWFTGNIGTTVSAEYLPPAAWPRPVTSPWLETGERNRVIVVDGAATADLLNRKTQRQTWRVNVSSESAELVFPTLFWEGWTAVIDDELAELTATPLSGLMRLNVPQGEHEIGLVLERTRVRRTAELISLSVLVLIVAVFATDTRRWQLNHAVLIMLAIPTLALVTIGLAFVVAPAIPQADDVPYSQDFAQLGWLHPQEQIVFGNGQTLAGVSFGQDGVTAGETLEINLDGNLTGEIALIDPADNFVDAAFSIATAPIQNGSALLQIPADAPSGLFAPRIRLNDESLAQTASGENRGEIYLRPIRVFPADGLSQADAGLDVRAVAVTQPEPTKLRLHLAWRTAEPLAENLVASFRLTDANGMEIHAAQQDFQPGFGHRPTSGWRPNEPVFDVMGMSLPQPLPFEGPWTLLVVLYEVDSGQPRLFRRLGTLNGPSDQLTFEPPENDLALPADLMPVEQTLSAEGEDVLALRGFVTEQAEDGLHVSLFWEALVAPPADYTHFVHLISQDGTEPAAQHDAMPGNNTWATGQLAAGQIIEDRLFLPTADLPAGPYTLSTGLYDTGQEGFPRLQVSGRNDGVIVLQELMVNDGR